MAKYSSKITLANGQDTCYYPSFISNRIVSSQSPALLSLPLQANALHPRPHCLPPRVLISPVGTEAQHPLQEK